MVNAVFLNQTKTTQLESLRPGESIHCYTIQILNGNQTGIWQEMNPVSFALPAFVMQLIIITSLSHLLLLLLKPLRQPRIVAEILAGVLLGPSVMGRMTKHSTFLGAVFSIPSFMTLETMGNIGLIYFIFLLGLEMDITTISRVGKKAFAIAIAGTVFPFAVGLSSYYLLLPNFGKAFQMGSIVWGVSLTVTSLPVITQILAKLKLLSTNIGKTAMSAAMVNTIISWVLVTIMTAVGSSVKSAPWALLSTLGFVLLCAFVIRPAIVWTIHRTQKGGSYSEETICIILTAVLGCGLATDLLGTNSMIGAFVLGVVIPNGLLGPRFLEVLKGFVEDLLMPVFFMVSGMRTNFDAAASFSSWFLIVVVIGLACLVKVVSTIVVSLLYGMPVREGFALAVLMNTKGLLALIAINSGRDRVMIDDKAFTVMLISILLMTMATQPILTLLFKPTKRFLPSKHRAIQRLKPDAELRILACVHEPHSVAATISLLHLSNPTRRSPIAIFALHLVQLTGHTTALLIVHGHTKSSPSQTVRASSGILDAFERFEEEHGGGVSVQPLTAVSPYDTMHEDICGMAEDKRVTLIILPYHKRHTIHNKLEEINPAYKDVNDNVLANSPCSVAILVDRGFVAEEDSGSGGGGTRHIVMIFIGGADDREALCYARKMAGHPKVTLTVVRLVHSKSEVVDLKLEDLIDEEKDKIPVESIDSKVEFRLDESFISEFRHRTAGDKSVVYYEKVVRNGAEMIEIIRSMGNGYDLFVVGRRVGISSPITAGIDEWSKCMELGAIGDLLVTAEFLATISVLVVQQYGGRRVGSDGGEGAVNPPLPSESGFVAP